MSQWTDMTSPPPLCNAAVAYTACAKSAYAKAEAIVGATVPVSSPQYSTLVQLKASAFIAAECLPLCGTSGESMSPTAADDPRQTDKYLECMATKLPYCLQGFCPDGSVCTYQQCWAQADAACLAAAAVPAGKLPPPPTPVAETSDNLNIIGLIYTAAQVITGALPAGTEPANIDPSTIPPQLPPLIPALQVSLPALNTLGIDPAAVLQDLLGYHVAVQQKKLTGNTSPVTWADVNKALTEPVNTVEAPPVTPPPSPTDTAKKEKKTGWLIYGLGAAAAVGAIVLWSKRDQR